MKRILMAVVLLLSSMVVVTGAFAAQQYKIGVDGLACPFCAYGIEKKLRAIPGARDVKVDLEEGRATFEAPSGAVTEQQVKQAVKDAGFSPGKIEIKHER